MKKNSVLFIFIIFSLIICSCSENQNYKVNSNSHPSLKNKITYMDKKTEWSEPLDNILIEKNTEEKDKSITKKISSFSNQEQRKNSSRKLPPGIMEDSSSDRLFYKSKKELNKKIYPKLEGFSDLDISELNEASLNAISCFIDGMKFKDPDMSVVSKNSQFLKPVFKYDFEKLGEIESYIVGKPFIVKNDSIDEYQVPVRLKTKDGYFDVVFFMEESEKKYYIEQIYYRGLISE